MMPPKGAAFAPPAKLACLSMTGYLRYLRIAFSAICVIAAMLFVLNRWTHSELYVRGTEENSWNLWIAVWKGFGGPVYYMGSDADYSYFRTDGLIADRFKVKTSGIRLPRTFPLSESEPYSVTREVVPSH